MSLCFDTTSSSILGSESKLVRLAAFVLLLSAVYVGGREEIDSFSPKGLFVIDDEVPLVNVICLKIWRLSSAQEDEHVRLGDG